MFGKKNSDNDLLIKRIKDCSLFEGFSGGEIRSLLEITHIRDYSEGEMIFTHNTIGLCFYIVVTGSVKIISEINGSQAVIKELAAGEHF